MKDTMHYHGSSIPDDRRVREIIRSLWNQLTESEIDALADRRDEFFMAVKKKHGVVRAQAEIMLREIAGDLLPFLHEAA
jgi:hypothetical protein